MNKESVVTNIIGHLNWRINVSPWKRVWDSTAPFLRRQGSFIRQPHRRAPFQIRRQTIDLARDKSCVSILRREPLTKSFCGLDSDPQNRVGRSLNEVAFKFQSSPSMVGIVPFSSDKNIEIHHTSLPNTDIQLTHLHESHPQGVRPSFHRRTWQTQHLLNPIRVLCARVVKGFV